MATWLMELDHPSAGFFRAFSGLAGEAAGPEDATREAVLRLTPAVDWAAYLPHIPHGLMGLQAVYRLRPLLQPASFRRILATQLHAFAHESRCHAAHGLGAIGNGSGNWDNLRMALAQHRPAIAWGEARSMAEARWEPFRLLEEAAEGDMANVGHKPVLARTLGELFLALEEPAEAGRTMLALAAWQCASEPYDRFWHERAAHRLGEAGPVPFQAALQTPEAHREQVREVCDSGLVDLLDRFSARVRGGGSGDLLAVLALAAAEKQLDARRDLEGKTMWNFVFLAALAKRTAEAGASAPEGWVQAAALVNLFPTGEEEDRPVPAPPRVVPQDPAAAALDAILDGEPLPAMGLAQLLVDREGPDPLLRVLAEAASSNDPAFNYSHQVLAVAGAADLLPQLPEHARAGVLVALAKALANSQGSSDLGRLADASV
ncbi:MAG: hypothetical protein P4L36_07190 [Holophaga sp.]|nr:hypothetical protein [Holophaga sp.]